MRIPDRVHERFVAAGRVHRLSALLAERLPPRGRVLDLGCGDGRITDGVQARRPEIHLIGADVLLRPGAALPVLPFDGISLPFRDRSFDVVMLVDVLHHTLEPEAVMAEASRVASQALLVKDHLLEGRLARPTLAAMDYVGNRRHGVALPYNYWPLARWRRAFDHLQLQPQAWTTALRLYPPALRPLFERSLHFVTLLAKQDAGARSTPAL